MERSKPKDEKNRDEAEGKVQVATCESCRCIFVIDTGVLNWVKEPDDPNLDYDRWRTSFYCVRCGEPTSLWKRSGVKDGPKEPQDIIDELTSKTRVIDRISYVTTADYAKACSVALELHRKYRKAQKENIGMKSMVSELEAGTDDGR